MSNTAKGIRECFEIRFLPQTPALAPGAIVNTDKRRSLIKTSSKTLLYPFQQGHKGKKEP
jgi:hypothetical protein